VRHFSLGVTLLVLLVASINYQPGLDYLLTFFARRLCAGRRCMCHATPAGIGTNLVAPRHQRCHFLTSNDQHPQQHALRHRGAGAHPDTSPAGAKTDKTPHCWTDIPARATALCAWPSPLSEVCGASP
jgi:hypothetical protein